MNRVIVIIIFFILVGRSWDDEWARSVDGVTGITRDDKKKRG